MNRIQADIELERDRQRAKWGEMDFHVDYHQLTDLLCDVVGKLLREREDFPPFAASVAPDGSMSLYDADCWL